jgi:ribulose-phosphate 3-epimerase
MDGVFCPRMTVGPPLVAAIPDEFLVDVHLMIDEPLEKVDAYVDAGAAVITFHVESTSDCRAVLERLRDRGVVRGLALNPRTSVSAVVPLLDELELLLVLAVAPGVSGQTFDPGTAARVQVARRLIAGRDIALGIDGGVTRDNVYDVASLPVDLIVTGTAVFAGGDVTDNARFMLSAPLRAGRPGSSSSPATTATKKARKP